MAYLYRASSNVGNVSSISCSAWVYVPSYLAFNLLTGAVNGTHGTGATIGGSISFVANSTTLAISLGFSSPNAYFGTWVQHFEDPEDDVTWTSVHGELSAAASNFATSPGSWCLAQASVTTQTSEHLGGGGNSYGKASFAANSVPLSIASSGSSIYGYNNGWQVLPPAEFATYPISFAGQLYFSHPNGIGINRYADVYVWTNKYIDFSNAANCSKFIRIDGTRAYPRLPDLVTAEFGVPSMYFRGKSSDNSFFFNRGTAGSFSKIGTTTDFTPAPSYG